MSDFFVTRGFLERTQFCELTFIHLLPAPRSRTPITNTPNTQKHHLYQATPLLRNFQQLPGGDHIKPPLACTRPCPSNLLSPISNSIVTDQSPSLMDTHHAHGEHLLHFFLTSLGATSSGKPSLTDPSSVHSALRPSHMR